MTVGELIEQLQKFDPDMPIVCYDRYIQDHDDIQDVEAGEINREGEGEGKEAAVIWPV
ncbi:hypothetical protein OQJ68_10755 [Microbulbifer thermotolerans]|uniref:Uncharacterized protein n=1 Tax=Microbulbifer thermotolerans TaxID=252514 RepID=A0AB35I1I8_MICTH|nr:hypothetical protein [Microbulbifer thermotolerans]MCX2802265.1 hypothetical protein [Microbulbifer thermotolerans]